MKKFMKGSWRRRRAVNTQHTTCCLRVILKPSWNTHQNHSFTKNSNVHKSNTRSDSHYSRNWKENCILRKTTEVLQLPSDNLHKLLQQLRLCKNTIQIYRQKLDPSTRSTYKQSKKWLRHLQWFPSSSKWIISKHSEDYSTTSIGALHFT
jgi:hypothetical protein